MLRVLIADDEVPFVNSLLRFNWVKQQCRCVGTAHNGREALKKCRELLPHIVITDIHMPVMDGITLMQHIRQEYPEIQIILLTVHCQFAYAQEAVRAGATDYIIKDMNFRSSLEAALEKAARAFSSGAASDLRSGLLMRHAKLIQLDSTASPIVSDALLEPFLKKNAGLLIAVQLKTRSDSVRALLERLDTLYSMQKESPGIIVWANDLFELLSPRPTGLASAWIRETVQQKIPPFEAGERCARIVMGGAVAGIQDYWKNHHRGINTLDLDFYDRQPDYQQAKDILLAALPQTTIEQWVRKSELLGTSQEKIRQHLLEEVVPVLRNSVYQPDQVRKAFEYWFNRLELKYASSILLQAHHRIAETRTLDSLVDAFLEEAASLLSSAKGYSYQVNQAVEYIAGHLNMPTLQLNEVAAHVSISPSYLSKRLKEETGQSFQDLLIHMRMESAVYLLRNTADKIYEISEKCGYKNYRTFINAFTSHFGYSPRTIR
jgi:two-component system, response regulator YesN